MNITFPCPGCGARLGIDKAAAGQSVGCPHCEKEVQVPLPARLEKTHFEDCIAFRCPRCRSKYAIPTEGAGFFYTCPGCKTEMQIPTGSMPSAPTRPERPGMLTPEEVEFLST